VPDAVFTPVPSQHIRYMTSDVFFTCQNVGTRLRDAFLALFTRWLRSYPSVTRRNRPSHAEHTTSSRFSSSTSPAPRSRASLSAHLGLHHHAEGAHAEYMLTPGIGGGDGETDADAAAPAELARLAPLAPSIRAAAAHA
jgi:hypothetical protein